MLSKTSTYSRHPTMLSWPYTTRTSKIYLSYSPFPVPAIRPFSQTTIGRSLHSFHNVEMTQESFSVNNVNKRPSGTLIDVNKEYTQEFLSRGALSYKEWWIPMDSKWIQPKYFSKDLEGQLSATTELVLTQWLGGKTEKNSLPKQSKIALSWILDDISLSALLWNIQQCVCSLSPYPVDQNWLLLDSSTNHKRRFRLSKQTDPMK